MVDFGLFLVLLCLAFLFAMCGLCKLIEFISDWNREKLLVEEHEEKKKTKDKKIGFATEQKPKEDEEKEEDKVITPYDLTRGILNGTIDIDKAMEE